MSMMQKWWDEAMARDMNVPEGYSQIAVLLIKWADEVDELRTANEVRELEALFRDRFHYFTRTAEMDGRKKAQHQLSSHISDFIRDHDGPHNLLIVYYTGHGIYYEDDKYLELSATSIPSPSKEASKDSRCNWNQAERRLQEEEVESDVLTILDTCYSSNLVECGWASEKRKFELLSACSIDSTTASPGKKSFTRALIDALDELLQERHDNPFSTFHLNQRILRDRRRSTTPSQLWSRVPRSEQQHILLAPLQPQRLRLDARQQLAAHHLLPPPKGYLTLRFVLRDASLTQEQIGVMTRTLSCAFNTKAKAMVGLRQIEWLDIRPAAAAAAPRKMRLDLSALIAFVVARWRKMMAMRRGKDEKLAIAD